jgi:undecaprenyl-diphosphatase
MSMTSRSISGAAAAVASSGVMTGSFWPGPRRVLARVPAQLPPSAPVPILHAIILGIVQGLTEFLPISSSGHLILVPWLFGWDDFAGQPGLEKTFDVALHIGTLVGAVAYFRRDLVRLAIAAFRQPRSTDGRLAWLLLVSAVPAAITGALLADFIEEETGAIWLIGVMLIVFGLIMYWADQLQGARPIEDFRLTDALTMGVGQALALQPGVSRSGVTITVGRIRRFNRDAAARISFLMSLPIIAGAIAFSGVDVMSEGGIPSDFVAPFLWGILASGVSGWFAVWATLKIVRTHSFLPFVIYRVVLGVLIIMLAASPWR